MQLCNLANVLDHSGRWVEAYDAYVRALDADPENGAAAGNAAVLIERAIGNGWDIDGHLCSLYDHYLSQAKSNRAVTVAVAGEHAAHKYDAMELLGSDEPVFDPPHEDAYRDWVADHRLALIAALEGTGGQSEDGRWDAIGLTSVTDTSSSSVAPRIFSILNVLKGDFLVARRLAFEAEQVLDETGGWQLHDSDTGTYTDTLQYEVHGEAVSKLVLAHRAALDVLDKTAVAVNDHLEVGDAPTKVWFRKFWFEDKQCTRLREELVKHGGLSTAILSMAELAVDMAPGAMYEHAQDVRNAGTHRFILVHQGLADVESSPTMQAMDPGGYARSVPPVPHGGARRVYLPRRSACRVRVAKGAQGRANGSPLPARRLLNVRTIRIHEVARPARIKRLAAVFTFCEAKKSTQSCRKGSASDAPSLGRGADMSGRSADVDSAHNIHPEFPANSGQGTPCSHVEAEPVPREGQYAAAVGTSGSTCGFACHAVGRGFVTD